LRALTDHGQHEEAAETVDRAEQDEEVRRLQAGRAVGHGDHANDHRRPAQPQREQELRDELAPVGIGRAQRRHQRLAGEHHDVAGLLQRVAGGEHEAVGGRTDHK